MDGTEPSSRSPGSFRWRRFLRIPLRDRVLTARDILWDTVNNFLMNGDFNQAAAISLYTILSMIPLFLLSFLAANDVFSTYPEILSDLTAAIRGFYPSFSESLFEQIGRVEMQRTGLGWIGIVGLLWLSTMIFNAIETAFAVIFRTKTLRNYVLSKLMALGMIPVGWAIGVASVIITYLATVVASQPLLLREEFAFVMVFHGVFFRFFLPFLVTVAFIAIVYRVIPTVRISWTQAVLASVIFSLLMEAAKLFFTWYVAHYTRYNLIYGSLETVVVLMFWTFYVALILLFCAELIFSYGRRDQLLWEKAFVKIGAGRDLESRLFRRFGRIYPRGAYIFQEGDRSRNLYYLLKGRIQMEKRVGVSAKVIEEKGPGEFFGEMALLLDAPRAASSKAIADSEIVSIDGPMLMELFHHSEKVARRILVQFAERLRQSYGAVNGLSHAILLLLIGLYLSEERPRSDPQDPASALQQAIRYDPEEIRAALGELTAEGILSFRDDGEAVLQPEKLREKILFMIARRRPGADG